MRNRILILIILVSAGFSGFAQSSNLSPYSRFGLGDIYQPGSVPIYGFGGVRSTLNDPFTVNVSNPATLGSLFNTTFQGGLRYQTLRITEGEESQNLADGNLDQFFLGLKRAGSNLGFVFGFTPFSTSGYNLTTENEDEVVGTYTSSYEGIGGYNKVVLGVGRKFDFKEIKRFENSAGVVYDSLRVTVQSLSIGANTNYYFGSIEQTSRIDIEDPTFLDTRRIATTRLSDFGFDLGVHYELNFGMKYGKDRRLVSRNVLQLAAVFTPDANLNANQEYVFENTVTSSGVVFPLDTSVYYDASGDLFLPGDLRFGISLQRYNKNGRHFMLSTDYSTRDWTQFSTTFEEDFIQGTLLASSEISIGFQFTPKQVSDGETFFSRANYRAGMRSAQTYLEVNGVQLKDEAITFGASFPILNSRSTSKIHIGMEFGTRGVNEGDLIKEEYMNIHFGFSLSPYIKNKWFVERKYQ
ncbi:MAG: hypothetical protein ACJAU0_001210 [Flavobacteriales bacterium]|jgi:hypothetical protein